MINENGLAHKWLQMPLTFFLTLTSPIATLQSNKSYLQVFKHKINCVYVKFVTFCSICSKLT